MLLLYLVIDYCSLKVNNGLTGLTRLALFHDVSVCGESIKHGPLAHGPGPWTPSVGQVHQNMDRVHGPPNHGPGPWTPYFYYPKITLANKNKISKLKKKRINSNISN